jgi:hypothetical protein
MLWLSEGVFFNIFFFFSYSFVVSGASESVGKHMLEACNNNLEMAVTMFLDGGGIAEEPSTSSASVSTVRQHTEYELIIYC